MPDQNNPAPGLTHDKLLAMVPSYRAGYVSGGGRDDDLRDDEDIVRKMDEAHVWNESLAEQAGREDGFKAREDAKKKGHW